MRSIYVAGYCVANDVSERAFQLQSAQWDKGKSCDTFGPLGPWLVTPDEIPDPQPLDMWLDVNGERMQDRQYPHDDLSGAQDHLGRERVHDARAWRHHRDRDAARRGNGQAAAPGHLEPGDIVTLGIDSALGQQRQRVVPFRPQ